MLSMLGKVIQGFVSIVQAIQPFVSANPYRFRFSIAPVVAHQVSSISFRMSDPCEPARIGKYFKADPALLVINISRCFHGIPLTMYARYPSAPGKTYWKAPREELAARV